MKYINNIFLVIGITGGLSAALYSLLGHGQKGLPDYAVARVNDSYITRAVYERALDAMDTDKRTALTADDRQHILNRLIDEELLIQYGIRQGLVRSDRQVKSTLVQSVIQAKSLQAEAADISDAQAMEFFESNRTLFSPTGRVRVGMIRVPASESRHIDEAKLRAQEAWQRLNKGEAFDVIQAEYHEGGVLNLPNTSLPYGKLVDYLGPTLAEMAMNTPAGQAAEPLLLGQAWQVLYAHEHVIAAQPDFSSVKELVIAEMRRRAAEDIVRKSLDEMRDTESIVIAEDL